MLLDYHLASLLINSSEIVLVSTWSRLEFVHFACSLVWKFEATGLCSCSRRVHLLSQVVWLPAINMVREAHRSSSCMTTLAGELLFVFIA